MQNRKEMLLILGAGATISLTKNNGNDSLRFSNSSEEMVKALSGNELINRIINHKYKVIAGILTLLYYKLFLREGQIFQRGIGNIITHH